MTKIPGVLLKPPAPAPAQQGKENGSHPPSAPDTPFAAVLDDHQARTADAEGHGRADEAPAQDAALAALLGAVPLQAGAPVADAAAGPAEPEPLSGRVLSAPGARTRNSDPGTCILTATRPIGVPDATALPLRPPIPAAASAPSSPVGLDAAAAEGRSDAAGAAVAMPAVARATRLADVLQAAVRPDAAEAAEPGATPSAATAAGRAQAAAEGDGPARAAAPAAAAAPTATPAVTPAAPAAPPALARADMPLPTRAVGLEHAVETVRLALRAGAERGVTHARISLAPRELGTIEVHLRHTADGLVARVVAEHATAVQQLQQTGAELRRQLEQQGIDVLRLDIGASGEQGGRAADRRPLADRERRGTGADPLAPLDGVADADAGGEPTTTLQLPNGALVDVLA